MMDTRDEKRWLRPAVYDTHRDLPTAKLITPRRRRPFKMVAAPSIRDGDAHILPGSFIACNARTKGDVSHALWQKHVFHQVYEAYRRGEDGMGASLLSQWMTEHWNYRPTFNVRWVVWNSWQDVVPTAVFYGALPNV